MADTKKESQKHSGRDVNLPESAKHSFEKMLTWFPASSILYNVYNLMLHE